jgi:hypothetical protein
MIVIGLNPIPADEAFYAGAREGRAGIILGVRGRGGRGREKQRKSKATHVV